MILTIDLEVQGNILLPWLIAWVYMSKVPSTTKFARYSDYMDKAHLFYNLDADIEGEG